MSSPLEKHDYTEHDHTAADAMKVSTPSEREIHVERVFNAPRDLVWRAHTEPELLAQWWGRGNKVDVERFELERGGHWRFVEHGPEGPQGFEGRFREVTPQERLVQTFEWDGMPGHVALNTTTLEAVGPDRTRLVTDSLFLTTADRDGMVESGMKTGLDQSYEALDAVLARLRTGAA